MFMSLLCLVCYLMYLTTSCDELSKASDRFKTELFSRSTEFCGFIPKKLVSIAVKRNVCFDPLTP